jgi:hypothetical protein
VPESSHPKPGLPTLKFPVFFVVFVGEQHVRSKWPVASSIKIPEGPAGKKGFSKKLKIARKRWGIVENVCKMHR